MVLAAGNRIRIVEMVKEASTFEELWFL